MTTGPRLSLLGPCQPNSMASFCRAWLLFQGIRHLTEKVQKVLSLKAEKGGAPVERSFVASSIGANFCILAIGLTSVERQKPLDWRISSGSCSATETPNPPRGGLLLVMTCQAKSCDSFSAVGLAQSGCTSFGSPQRSRVANASVPKDDPDNLMHLLFRGGSVVK